VHHEIRGIDLDTRNFIATARAAGRRHHAS
jgi:hypothetical protein